MKGAVAKKIRKEFKKGLKENFNEFVETIESLPFFERWKLCRKLLWKKL